MSGSAATVRQPLLKNEYESVGSSRKLNLLLQRSVRYSYRQRCCNCCPTILCELLFPFILIMMLILSRYGIDKLDEQIKNSDESMRGPFDQPRCSQNLTTPPTTSDEIFMRCFKFPPRYRDSWGRINPDDVSNRTDFVFEPNRTDIHELGQITLTRLRAMGCTNTDVRVQNPDDTTNSDLLRNRTINTVIIDFASTNNLKTERKLAYNIVVRQPNAITLNSDPIDTSFLSYKHPAVLADRSNMTNNEKEGSELPEFSDVKMFIDVLLMEYQTNRTIEYQLERNLMTCTPFRDDFLFTTPSNLVGILMIMVDVIFLIPYLILLTSSIREKNAKVKEILKVLGIEPILNNFAQAIRTMVIFLILIILLCLAYKLKLETNAYFVTVNYAILFFGNLIYTLQLVSFCIMNAQIFNSNVRAIIFTLVLYFVSINIFSWVISWPPGIQYLVMFFCPFIAGRSLFLQALLHDLANKDVALFRTLYRHMPVYFSTLIVMIASCIFYWALSWYLEKVFPGEYGIPQEWNFLFKRDYWRKSSPENPTYAYDNHASKLSTASITPIARRNSSGTAVVHVDRLVKKFGPDKTAVNEVSFDLYENQITSLLGPNGSGKTTIFNCLIGIYKQTSGTITMVNEYGMDCDTRHNIEMLRKSIGYCPQHDILFDLLTIEEQIQFYASARGFGKRKQEISDEMLKLVSLENAKDTYCQALSGGMKRRLSLACAFVGDTKIVLLDEPSSGLDPSNRRALWDWLRTMKEGKTLLLTTHFMEESDALSDRIMIISNGVIKADGTSARLKEQYGSGYKLVVNKQGNFPTNQVEGELRVYLPKINVESDVPDVEGDVVFRTNQHPDEQFVQALRRLESMKTQGLIKNYGVQNSTMDDVFLKITRDIREAKQNGATTVNMEHIDGQCRHVFDNAQFVTGFQYYLTQLYGLLIKTFLVRYRRWGLTLIVLLIPIIYNLLSNIISESQSTTGTYKMDTNLLNPQTIPYDIDSSMERYFQAAVNSKSKDVKLDKRTDNISEINEYIWHRRKERPYTYTDTYLGFQIPAPEGNRYKVQALSSNLITGYEIFSVASDTVYKHVLNDTSASIRSTLIYKRTGNLTVEPTIGGLMNILSIASCFLKFIPTSLILDVFVFYVIFLYTSIFLASERKDSFLSLLNISGLHPAFYWLFNYIFDLITCVIWFCYLLAIYCVFDVAFNGLPENRKSSSGTIPIEFGNSWDLRIQFYPLSIIIALPTLPFVYLLTKIFPSDILCGLLVLFLLIILHIIGIIVPIIMSIIKSDLAPQIVYWIFNIISPSLNAQAIITKLLADKSLFCKFFVIDFDLFKPIGNNTIPINWIILVLHIIIFILLLIAIDMGLLKFSSLFSSSYVPFDENGLDSDVLAERHRILNSDASSINTDSHELRQNTDHLTVHDLVKRYRGRTNFAVNHLTFGAKRGEAFGLLGYNGAGKTTTFRILVGDETATSGTAFIDGQNIRNRLRSIRRLGYCPQENCNMEFLTVQDGLYLLARIRGVPSPRIHSVVQTISSLFLLDPFLNNYIHQLSGGTKRRLHAALALIGPPLVVILDEPTTGVDPDARQQMQEIFLNAVKAKLTIILTSHSMDECERVCNRLGIMFEGQLACLGTIQHLKSKFGQGYTIEIKVRTIPGDLNGATIQNVQSFLLSQQEFNIEPREITGSTASFQVRQGTPADLFQILEQNKQQLNIETYTISQTTLEQIFLSFGKKGNALDE